MTFLAPLPSSLLLPVPTGTEAAAFDRAAEGRGAPGRVLMEAAGRAAADVAMEILRREGREGPVLVAAGGGKNGGDAVVLARTLHARGLPVLLLVDPRRPDPDPLLHGHPVPVDSLPGAGAAVPGLTPGSAPALLVDGLLGTGLSGPPREPVSGWIAMLNRLAGESGAPVLALDLPSGVEGDSGRTPGTWVEAGYTVAFGAPKVGNLLHPGRARGGRLVVVEMGFPPWPRVAATGALITGAWARAHLPGHDARTHKNAAGRLLLLAGGEAYGGAVLLASRGALRGGVGMLRVACHPRHHPVLLEALPEIILVDAGSPAALEAALQASDAVVAGPGMGTDPASPLARGLCRVMESLGARDASVPSLPLLLDADALTLLAQGSLPGWPAEAPVLLTPHAGEYRRFGAGDPPLPDPVADPLEAARALARTRGGWVLLKGTPSVVASPEDAGEPVLVSASGGSTFARGGMGDVLSGVIGALLARGCPPGEAAGLGLHLTGRAADRAGEGGAPLPHEVADGIAGAWAEGTGAGAVRSARGSASGSPPNAGSPGEPLGIAGILLELEAPR